MNIPKELCYYELKKLLGFKYTIHVGLDKEAIDIWNPYSPKMDDKKVTLSYEFPFKIYHEIRIYKELNSELKQLYNIMYYPDENKATYDDTIHKGELTMKELSMKEVIDYIEKKEVKC